MEWLNRMMDALDYMERNMAEQLDIEDISKAAYASPSHFQRLFFMIIGMSVTDYIRKRRLTLAAQELAIKSDAKVLDIALKYGYDTPESFTKAFKKAHGIPPSAARRSGVSLKAFPRISFQLSLKGEKDMDYKLVEREAFKVTGRSMQVSTRDGENFVKIPQFWNAFNSDGSCEKLSNIAVKDEVLGICTEMDFKNEMLTYMIAVEAGDNVTNEDYDTKEIPASTWAVFTSVGPMPGAIQKIWERIFHEWFPATGYEHTGGPEMEVYPAGDTAAEDYRCEVWIPIVKK